MLSRQCSPMRASLHQNAINISAARLIIKNLQPRVNSLPLLSALPWKTNFWSIFSVYTPMNAKCFEIVSATPHFYGWVNEINDEAIEKLSLSAAGLLIFYTQLITQIGPQQTPTSCNQHFSPFFSLPGLMCIKLLLEVQAPQEACLISYNTRETLIIGSLFSESCGCAFFRA